MEKVEVSAFKESMFKFAEDTRMKLYEITEQMNEIKKYVDLEDIPDIGITFNNKIVELAHQFEKVGLSLYIEERYGVMTESFVGEAICFDLMNYVKESIDFLSTYVNELQRTTNIKVEKVQKLNDKSPFKRLFARLKYLISSKKAEYSEYNEEETNSINRHLSSYRDINNQLFNYRLEKNIVGSIVKRFEEWQSYFNVLGLLIDSIFPVLEKLGLPHLKQEIINRLSDQDKKRLEDLINNQNRTLSNAELKKILTNAEAALKSSEFAETPSNHFKK